MIRARLKEGLVVFRTGEEDNDKVVKIESLVKTLNNILALGHTSSYGNGIEVDFNCLKGVQAVHSVNGITLISENGDCEIKDIVMVEIQEMMDYSVAIHFHTYDGKLIILEIEKA